MVLFFNLFCSVVCYIDWLEDAEKYLHPWDVWSFTVLLDTDILVFSWGCIYVYQWYVGLQFSFVVSLSGFLSGWWWPHKMNWEVLLSTFWNSFRQIGVNSSLHVGKFACDAIRHWTLWFVKVLMWFHLVLWLVCTYFLFFLVQSRETACFLIICPFSLGCPFIGI